MECLCPDRLSISGRGHWLEFDIVASLLPDCGIEYGVVDKQSCLVNHLETGFNHAKAVMSIVVVLFQHRPVSLYCIAQLHPASVIEFCAVEVRSWYASPDDMWSIVG